MAVQWDENLTVGIDMIDYQHRMIFGNINTLLDAMAQSMRNKEVGKLIEFLTDYMIKHFCAEEELMIKHNYNAYPLQEAEHTIFIENLIDLRKEFETKCITSNLLLRIQQQLCNWLTKHIRGEDKDFGAFLKMRAQFGYLINSTGNVELF